MSNTIRNILKMLGIAFGLWVFFAIVTPWLFALSPAWQQYDAAQEKYGLDSGALYYTNIPNIQEAEENSRRAVREGMQARREARRKAGKKAD